LSAEERRPRKIKPFVVSVVGVMVLLAGLLLLAVGYTTLFLLLDRGSWREAAGGAAMFALPGGVLVAVGLGTVRRRRWALLLGAATSAHAVVAFLIFGIVAGVVAILGATTTGGRILAAVVALMGVGVGSTVPVLVASFYFHPGVGLHFLRGDPASKPLLSPARAVLALNLAIAASLATAAAADTAPRTSLPVLNIVTSAMLAAGFLFGVWSTLSHRSWAWHVAGALKAVSWMRIFASMLAPTAWGKLSLPVPVAYVVVTMILGGTILLVFDGAILYYSRIARVRGSGRPEESA
jgi:hypothetical protein